MPSNTTTNDLIMLIRRLGCVHKALKAEFELSHYRNHGSVPADSVYIDSVRVVDGKEEIAVK